MALIFKITLQSASLQLCNSPEKANFHFLGQLVLTRFSSHLFIKVTHIDSLKLKNCSILRKRDYIWEFKPYPFVQKNDILQLGTLWDLLAFVVFYWNASWKCRNRMRWVSLDELGCRYKLIFSSYKLLLQWWPRLEICIWGSFNTRFLHKTCG